MSVVYLRDVPMDVRLEAVRQLARLGEDTAEMLALAIEPGDISAVFDDSPELVTDYCQRGHPWTPENTDLRPDGRRCRECMRHYNRTYKARYRQQIHVTRKVPCAYCGEPATAPQDKGRGGLDTPRCRACFVAQMKAARKWR